MLDKIKIRWGKINKLRRNFVLFVLFGLAACIALLFLVRPSMCPSINDQWTGNSYQYSTPNHYGGEQYGTIVVEKNKPSYTSDAQTKDHYKENFYEVVCGEIKATDFALVFFTYILILVGLYQMRSTDETTKRAQRAYLVAGPPFGVPKEDSEDWAINHRAKASMFKGPWRMAIYNFGKTAGYTVKVEWGLCPESEFRTDKTVSELLTRKEFCEWRSKYVQPSVIIQDILVPTGNIAYQYRHVVIEDRDEFIGWVFFGRMIYKDVFRDMHYSTFSYKLTKDHHDSIGVSLSDDNE